MRQFALYLVVSLASACANERAAVCIHTDDPTPSPIVVEPERVVSVMVVSNDGNSCVVVIERVDGQTWLTDVPLKSGVAMEVNALSSSHVGYRLDHDRTPWAANLLSANNQYWSSAMPFMVQIAAQGGAYPVRPASCAEVRAGMASLRIAQ